MEIEIKEKIYTLEINKNCKKELRKASITAISIIIFVNLFFIYNTICFLYFHYLQAILL